jgi:hypothetical protein
VEVVVAWERIGCDVVVVLELDGDVEVHRDNGGVEEGRNGVDKMSSSFVSVCFLPDIPPISSIASVQGKKACDSSVEAGRNEKRRGEANVSYQNSWFLDVWNQWPS